jgi:glycosyltransferase involved in cell wall biosynthesis
LECLARGKLAPITVDRSIKQHTMDKQNTPVGRNLRIVSFNQTSLGGVSTWNIRAADAFATRPQLGIEFIAVESGRPEPTEVTRSLMSPEGRQRMSFVRTGFNKAEVALARWVRENPAMAEADVIVPNHCIEGWLFGEMLWKSRGPNRPAVIGGIHSDEDFFYDICGREGPCDAVFAVSSYCVEQFAKRYPHRPPARFIPYGVPVPDAVKSRRYEGPLKLAYCGRMAVKQKRVYDLVPLAESLVKRGVDFQLHLAGAGHEQAELLRRLHAVAGERVVYHGQLSPMKMPAFWADIDVFVQVSDFEGTSISMLESMAQGVAPVVTDVASGVRDVIVPGVSGELIPIGRMEAMAEAVQRLSDNRAALAEMGLSAWRRVREAYSLDASARAMANMFRDVVELNRGPFHVSPKHPRLARLERHRWLPNFALVGIRTAQKIMNERKKAKKAKAAANQRGANQAGLNQRGASQGGAGESLPNASSNQNAAVSSGETAASK